MALSDENVFAVYFASVAGWQYHPGSGHGEHKIHTIDEAALIALEMVRVHRVYFPTVLQED